jgi:hypothetical protein
VRRLIASAALWAQTASADDALTARERAEVPAQPLLQLDPLASPLLQGLRADVFADRAAIDLSPRASLDRTITLWSDPDTDALGWQWQGRLSYALAPSLRVTGTTSVGAVQSRFGSGLYVGVGVAITKLVQLSRWTTAWISLGAGYRGWSGSLVRDSTVMVRIGFTFR